MKKIAIILYVFAGLLGFSSCKDDKIQDIHFEDIEPYSIYDYIIMNKDQYSSFLRILEVGGLDKTLSAYNPEGAGYTLFLPDNAAIDSFLSNSSYASLEEMLADEEFVWYFSRYHVVSEMINANEFPFGAFSDLTLTEDYLAVSFIIETDSSYYKINNQAHVIRTNLEMSNGFIHLIKVALTPVTETSYGWLLSHQGYSIFRDAVEATGLNSLLNNNPKQEGSLMPFTLFIEHDSVYHKADIHTFADLADIISPDRADYTDPLNPLYNYVAYHVLTENYFLENFMQNDNGDRLSTNYSTFSDIPLHVDGTGLDIKINRGKYIFDTIIHSIGDTTFIDYVGFNYDASNLVTRSGVIHFIDQVLEQQPPSRAIQVFEVFQREELLEDYNEIGSYLIEDSTLLNNITYSGADLIYVREDPLQAPNGLWGDDYIEMDGDFTISFTTPKIVQGSYTVFLNADFINSENGVIEVYIDGKLVGGSVDLTIDPLDQATNDEPFNDVEIGEVSLVKYQAHKITIRTLIPGSFSWDFIRFEPL